MGCSLSAANVQQITKVDQFPLPAIPQTQLQFEAMTPINIIPRDTSASKGKIKPFKSELQPQEISKTNVTTAFALRKCESLDEMSLHEALAPITNADLHAAGSVQLSSPKADLENTTRGPAQEQKNLVQDQRPVAEIIHELAKIPECDSRQEFSQYQDDQLRKTILTHCKISHNSQELLSAVSKRASIHLQLRFGTIDESNIRVPSSENQFQNQNSSKMVSKYLEARNNQPIKSESVLLPVISQDTPLSSFNKLGHNPHSQSQAKSGKLPKIDETNLQVNRYAPESRKVKMGRSQSCGSLT